MGKRGPKPSAVEHLRLTGSRHAYDRKGEPDLIHGDPVPPEWLSDRAIVQWNLMVERFRGMQILSPGWRESLAMFCEAWAEYEELVIECNDAERVVLSAKGMHHINPLFQAKTKAWESVLKLGREFGFTPASKADIRKETKPQENSKSRFFCDGA